MEVLYDSMSKTKNGCVLINLFFLVMLILCKMNLKIRVEISNIDIVLNHKECFLIIYLVLLCSDCWVIWWLICYQLLKFEGKKLFTFVDHYSSIFIKWLICVNFKFWIYFWFGNTTKWFFEIFHLFITTVLFELNLSSLFELVINILNIYRFNLWAINFMSK